MSDADDEVLQGRLHPKPFKEGAAADFAANKHALLLHFDTEDPSRAIRKAWIQWFADFAPTNDNVWEYISTHSYHCPLTSFFESDACFGRTDHWSQQVKVAAEEVMFTSVFPARTAIALPTVRTSHSRFYPTAPYQVVEDGNVLFQSTIIERYKTHVEARMTKVYDSASYSVAILKALVLRRLNSNGSFPEISMLKKAELALVATSWVAEDFLTLRYRDLTREDAQFYGRLLSRPEEIDRLNVAEVASVGDVRLSLLDFQSLLGPLKATTLPTINAFMLLCGQRDAAVIDCYQQVNEKGRHYKERKASVFLSADTATALLFTELRLEDKLALLPLTLFSSCSLYIPILLPRNVIRAGGQGDRVIAEDPEQWVFISAIIVQKPAPPAPPPAAAAAAAAGGDDADGLPPPPPPPPTVSIILEVYRARFADDDAPLDEVKTAREAQNDGMVRELKTLLEGYATKELYTINWVTRAPAAGTRGRAAKVTCVGEDRSTRRFDDMEGLNVEALPQHWCRIAAAQDSGIFIMTAIEYMCFDVGFAWEPADMDLLRKHLAGYLLKGELPLF